MKYECDFVYVKKCVLYWPWQQILLFYLNIFIFIIITITGLTIRLPRRYGEIVKILGQLTPSTKSEFMCHCPHWTLFKWVIRNWNAQMVPWCSPSLSLCVSGITSRKLFHTSRHPTFGILTHELLYLASFARILGRNMIYSWFRGIKRNLLCWFRDMKIPTSRSVVKYGLGIYKISREVWNSWLSLHCYCFGWTIQQLQEVREVGFRSPWSSSAYPQCYPYGNNPDLSLVAL